MATSGVVIRREPRRFPLSGPAGASGISSCAKGYSFIVEEISKRTFAPIVAGQA
jgi:hypothetical protein